jgi:hypothetical protein
MRIRLFFIVSCLLLMPCFAMSQSEQTTEGKPPLEQPLVREGDMAVKLVEAFGLGTPVSEAEAESMLASLDITPRNGWIADYPVTPDIADELRVAVSDAAESGKIAVSKEDALKAVQDIMNGYDLPVRADTSGQAAPETTGPNYPDSTAENNYYYDEGPPVVTYYAPPPDYAYLYTWVPYPFWWSDSWFPGYFILIDFDVPEYRHRHGHDHDHGHHDHEHDHGKFISNHYVDTRTGGTFRVEPGRKPRGGASPAGTGWAATSTRSGAQTTVNTGRGQPAAGTYREFRGYGVSGSHTGTRSSAFDRSPNSQFERNASDRGFQSRSSAGRVGGGRPAGGGGSFRGSGFGGFHGGGGVRR